MEHQPPPFFNRGPAPLVRLTFFVSLAILLMVLDARFRYAESVRQVVALAAYPIQRVAMAPADLFHAVANYFGGTAALQEENAALKTKQLRVAPELLQLEALKEENNQLRRLLDAQERTPRKSVFAEILYAGRDPFSRKVVIDKGSQSGIQPGQPVIDDVGVIGQVTRVYLLMSEVTLLTDKDQAIPLQVLRNGLRAVAYGGAEGGMLDLRFMAANADIRNGDTLVTSGIDGTYPPGARGGAAGGGRRRRAGAGRGHRPLSPGAGAVERSQGAAAGGGRATGAEAAPEQALEEARITWNCTHNRNASCCRPKSASSC